MRNFSYIIVVTPFSYSTCDKLLGKKGILVC